MKPVWSCILRQILLQFHAQELVYIISLHKPGILMERKRWAEWVPVISGIETLEPISGATKYSRVEIYHQMRVWLVGEVKS